MTTHPATKRHHRQVDAELTRLESLLEEAEKRGFAQFAVLGTLLRNVVIASALASEYRRGLLELA